MCGQRVIDRCIGGYDPACAGIDRHLTNSNSIFRAHIRSDLEKDRLVRNLPCHLKKRSDERFILQISESRCIGRGDIDDDITAVILEHLDQCLIVAQSFALGSHFIFTDIDTDGIVKKIELFQTLKHIIASFVVETHRILDRLVFNETKEPGLLISILRLGCNRTDLGKPKAQSRQWQDILSIFVKSRTQPYRILESNSPDFLGKHWM